MGIKWGIIGAGDVAEVKSGPAFQKATNSELVAIMRRNEDKAKDFAGRHHVPYYYTDVDMLLGQKDIDAIYVASPPLHHTAHAIKALKAGKDVYLEKPLSINTENARKIIDVAQKTGRKLTVAHYRRQLPAFVYVKKLIQEHAVGKIRLATIRILQPVKSAIIASTEDNWRLNPDISGGGFFHDLAPHQIDLMLQYFGDAEWFSGSSGNQSGAYQADDAVTGAIRFSSGVQMQGAWIFSFGDQIEPVDECCLYGTEGNIHFSFYGGQVRVEKAGNIQTIDFENPANIQLPMIQQTTNYFMGKAPNPCTAQEALKGLEIMESFCTS